MTPATDTPPLFSANTRKTKIQVIARAVSVLRTLEGEADGLSLGAIAQRLKLPRSTVQRIVGALEAENLLIAASPNGRVKLGPALLRLSASVETSASAIAKPYMIEMARDLGETVDLSVMGRDHAIFIEMATFVLEAAGYAVDFESGAGPGLLEDAAAGFAGDSGGADFVVDVVRLIEREALPAFEFGDGRFADVVVEA